MTNETAPIMGAESEKRPSLSFGRVPRVYDSPLDQGIAPAVHILNAIDIATYESCEGGNGHAFPEPTVRFNGNYPEALRAVAELVNHGLYVYELRHVWRMDDGTLNGPWWDITLRTTP